MSRPRILIVNGGNRSALTCPGQDGKTTRFVEHAVASAPPWVDIDLLDLSVKGDGVIVQPCKGCIGTAGGYHCHWACDCYGPGSGSEHLPDLMHDADVYRRLELSDGFLVFTPVNWSGPTSQVKAMFDRLVCCNLTLTSGDADRVFGDRKKDPAVTRVADKGGGLARLLRNHLEGRVAGFFSHGDMGANDYTNGQQRPPATYPRERIGPRGAIEPLVEQCRYSGIVVPDDLVVGMVLNRGIDYATANDQPMTRAFEAAAGMVRRMAGTIAARRRLS